MYNSQFLAEEELEKVDGKKKVLVFHTDLSGALLLRMKGLNPRLVLAMPKDEKLHKIWLRKKYYHSFWDAKYVCKIV